MKLEIEDLTKEFKGRAPSITITLEKNGTETEDAEVELVIEGFDKVESYIILSEIIDSVYDGLTVRELEEVEAYFEDEE